MAFGDPLGYFNAGQAAGKASQSPFEVGAGNVMDVFKANIENQMKLAQTAALFKGEENYKNQVDPTKVTAQKRLDMANGNGGASSSTGQVSEAPSGPAPAGTPFPGALGTDVPTKVTDAFGRESTNQNAEAKKKLAEEQIAKTQSAAQAAQALIPAVDGLRDLYNKAVPHPVSVKGPFDMAGRAALAKQQFELEHLQGSGNPAWQNYKTGLDAFSTAIGRGEFTEVGRIPALQGMTNIKAYPGAGSSKEMTDGFWNLNYKKIASAYDIHNKTTRDLMGPNSGLEIHSNSKYMQDADQQKQSGMTDEEMNALREEGFDSIGKGADPKKVAGKFKNMTYGKEF